MSLVWAREWRIDWPDREAKERPMDFLLRLTFFERGGFRICLGKGRRGEMAGLRRGSRRFRPGFLCFRLGWALRMGDPRRGCRRLL